MFGTVEWWGCWGRRGQELGEWGDSGVGVGGIRRRRGGGVVLALAAAAEEEAEGREIGV